LQVLDGLTAEQRASWDVNGFLVLRGAYDKSQVDAMEDVMQWMWRERPQALVVDDTTKNVRSRLCSITSDRGSSRLKLNDLYLLSQTVRSFALHPAVVGVLANLLGEDPVLINTLSIDFGTTQGPHVDTLFMTPYSDDALVATWVALEDVGPEQGPLFYYPGSHKLPPYIFSTGLQTFIREEFDDWWQVIDRGMRERGIEREIFLPRRGDCFIWHARLVHGGSPILNYDRTRKSLVSHFFTKSDCINHKMQIHGLGRGYWYDREEAPCESVGDVVEMDPPGAFFDLPPVARAFRGSAQIDDVLQSGRSMPVTGEAITVDAARPFTLRGWAFDLDAPLERLGVRLPSGLTWSARYRLGRRDLVAAFGSAAVNDSGFLAPVPAGELAPGVHTLDIIGVAHRGRVHQRIASLQVRVV
jgi:ectoine hydroxylase-related dioxygenase (phytanoyl-CoA dioxygenase family)